MQQHYCRLQHGEYLQRSPFASKPPTLSLSRPSSTPTACSPVARISSGENPTPAFQRMSESKNKRAKSTGLTISPSCLSNKNSACARVVQWEVSVPWEVSTPLQFSLVYSISHMRRTVVHCNDLLESNNHHTKGQGFKRDDTSSHNIYDAT